MNHLVKPDRFKRINFLFLITICSREENGANGDNKAL